jgi:two-component system OmpR family sensor kinase
LNRLWVRFSLAFGCVVLIGATAIIGIGLVLFRASVTQSPGKELMPAPTGIITELTTYYREHQGWQDVDIFLKGAASVFPTDPGFILALDDADSEEVYASQPRVKGYFLQSYPIEIDGQVRGTLSVFFVRNDFWITVLARLREFLVLVGVVGGVVGIIFGVHMSRRIAAPLERLAAAAQAIGRRDLRQRVDLKGSREIVAVATAFNDMAAALEKAESLRRNLVADVAHELRTPLSVLQGNLLAILDGVYPLNAAEIAGLYNQTDVLNRLVNDLHDLSLADARQLPLKMQETDVAQLLNNVVTAFAPTAEAASVQLELDIAPELPCVLLDPLRLTQVLDNLLGNALRHTPAGGMVSLRANVAEDHLQLMVKDTGEGISEEHLPHVFDRFYRTNRGRSRATGGAGLGLAIVRAIVETHGGQVIVGSDGIPGHGTTFTARFPLKRA